MEGGPLISSCVARAHTHTYTLRKRNAPPGAAAGSVHAPVIGNLDVARHPPYWGQSV